MYEYILPRTSVAPLTDKGQLCLGHKEVITSIRVWYGITFLNLN